MMDITEKKKEFMELVSHDLGDTTNFEGESVDNKIWKFIEATLNEQEAKHKKELREAIESGVELGKVRSTLNNKDYGRFLLKVLGRYGLSEVAQPKPEKEEEK